MLLFVLAMPTLMIMLFLKRAIFLNGGNNARKNTLSHRPSSMLSHQLVGRVHPDTLVLGPSSREGHHASHVIALSGEAGREEVHLQDVFAKAGVEDLVVGEVTSRSHVFTS